MRGRKVKVIGTDGPWSEELRSWLEKHISKNSHLNTDILSRSQYIGVNKQALDSYLDCTYFLPKSVGGQGVDPKSSKVEDAIKAYRERIEVPVKHATAGKFVQTNNWFKLQSACRTAVNSRVIVVVYGKPGIGKSRCLTEFALKKLTTYPVSIICSRNVTPKYFVDDIAREVMAKRENSIAATEGEIVRKLSSYPRPFFIDQANYLGERSLGTICYIWERTKVPIVLLGTNDLYTSFTESSATEDTRAQISSRVTMYYHLSELSLVEAKSILQHGLGEDATDEAVAQIYNITAGIFRHIEMIIPRVRELKKNNRKELSSGETTMSNIIKLAGSRLVT